MDEIRSFTAIELPPALKEEIARYIEELRKTQRGIKWVKAKNLHITLKFIGERSAAMTKKITDALDTINYKDGKFSLEAAEIGAFPNKRKPRVIWIGLNAAPPESLVNLQAAVENHLNSIGIEKEKRPFSAHLTIGRIKFGDDFRRLWSYTEKHPFPAFSFDVADFALIKSVLKPEGAQYTIIKKYSLQ